MAWQRELFGYLEDIISRRLAERRAGTETAAADPDPPDHPPAEGALPESAPVGEVEAADRAAAASSPAADRAAAAGGPAADRAVVDSGLAAVAVSSGVDELDAHLGGGFFPGLWTIVGQPGTETTAFLGSVALEAVADHRAVVYYALAEGTEAVRDRLVDTLAVIMAGGLDDAPDDGAEWRSDSEGPPALDPAVWLAVLSRLWLVDSLPGGPEPVGVFLRSLERTLDDVASEVGHLPLVVIDDLETLLRRLGVERAVGAARVVTGLNGVLVRCASAGLMAARPELTTVLSPSEKANAEGLLQLGHGLIELLSRSPVRMDVTIHENPHANWRGTLPLVLHSSVGMFTAAV